MDRIKLLELHAQQGAPAAIVTRVRQYLDADAEITAARYRSDREAEERRQLRQATAQELQKLIAVVEDQADREDAKAQAADDAARAKVGSASTEPAGSLDRLRETDDPTEILALAERAVETRATGLDELLRVAEQRLRGMAAADMHARRLNGRASMAWHRLRNLASRSASPSISNQRARRDHRRADLRRRSLAAIQVAGADVAQAVRLAAVKSAIDQQPAASNVVAGSFFDRFPMTRR